MQEHGTRRLYFLPLLLSLWVLPVLSTPRVLPIVPKPREVRELGGYLLYTPASTGFRLAIRDSAAVLPAIDEICSTSVTLYGSAPLRRGTTRVILWAGVPGVDPAFDRMCASRGIAVNGLPGDEAYFLLIESRGVVVAARHARGVAYGLASLNQLLRAGASSHGRLPAVRVKDWPDLRIRAVMDDISRGPVPTPEFLRRQIRRYAELKINTICYYTEHVVLTKSHPEFAPADGALSIDEWHALSRYAKRYHIDLVGDFQSFGHFEKILATPRYAHLADGKSLLSPALEESYALLDDIYGEMVPAFDAPFFNVNCDETFELGQGRSKALVDSLGKGRVYLNHILRLREMLGRRGVRTMIWGDVLLQHPEMIDQLPRDVIIGTWTYDTLADFRQYITPFRSRDLDVLVTPGVLNSGNVIPNFRQSFLNIERFVRDGLAQNVMGALTTVWDDGGVALFSSDWYGVAFAADRMWYCDTLDRSYRERFDLGCYGDPSHALSRGIDSLMLLADLTATDAMSDRPLWTPVVPARFGTLRVSRQDWDHVLAIAEGAGSLLRTGAPRIDQVDYEVMQFVAELYQAVARLHLGICDVARDYRRARGCEVVDHSRARSLVLSGWSTVNDLQSRFEHLKRWFGRLWLTENRTYALDIVEARYDERIRDLQEVGNSLREALMAIDQGCRLPPEGAVRLDVNESEGWFFRDWLVTGPIAGSDVHVDRLAVMGGESGAVPPRVTQEFPVDGKTSRWSRLSARTAAEVALSEPSPGSEPSTFYAYASIECPSDRTIPALVGMGGSGRILVNGAIVFERARPDTFVIDGDTLHIALRKGTNRIMVKVCGSASSRWDFSFRLPESNVRNRKNRYRIIEGP